MVLVLLSMQGSGVSICSSIFDPRESYRIKNTSPSHCLLGDLVIGHVTYVETQKNNGGQEISKNCTQKIADIS